MQRRTDWQRARGLLLLVFLSIVSFDLSAAAGNASGKARDLSPAHLARINDVARIHERYAESLRGVRGVVGSGVSLDPDGSPYVRVYTTESATGAIPDQLEGVPVRIRRIEPFIARRGATCDKANDHVCSSAERWPLAVPTGISVGHPSITAGTIGARVRDANDRIHLLSNNHILAAVNQAALGDPILQPGVVDGGIAPDDTVASVSGYAVLVPCVNRFGTLQCRSANRIDAAIAESNSATLGATTPLGEFGSAIGYGSPATQLDRSFGDPQIQGDEDLAQILGESVQKFGRTSAFTVGQVDAVGVQILVCYGPSSDPCACPVGGACNVMLFVDQIEVAPGSFSAAGDSGSLIVATTQGREAVGLLFAGNGTSTLANRIDLVLTGIPGFSLHIDEGQPAGTADVPIPVGYFAALAVAILLIMMRAGRRHLTS
jgi:hypothetical protein